MRIFGLEDAYNNNEWKKWQKTIDTCWGMMGDNRVTLENNGSMQENGETTSRIA
jgi:hypothetical protein